MKEKNNKIIQIALFYYLPLILWMGLIFYFSSLAGLGRQDSPDIYFYISRKGAHVLEFFILTLLFIRATKSYFYRICDKSKNHLKTRIYLLPALFSLAYAFSDEIHQLFVVGREGKFLDVGIDLAGILLAVYLYNLFFERTKKKRETE